MVKSNIKTMLKVGMWLVGIIIALGSLVLTYNKERGYFEHPSIIAVAPFGTEKHCPPSIYFYGNPPFSLLFKNVGDKNAILEVGVDSQEVQFKESRKAWLLEIGAEPTPFHFVIKKNETALPTLTNFTIYYNYEYTDGKRDVSSEDFYCIYNKSSDLSYTLNG